MPAAKPDKRNLFREFKQEYCQPRTPMPVEIGGGSYLAVDGQGGPGGEVFQDRVGALYGMAYTVKFACKFAGSDFVVGKLEALYGIDVPTDQLAALPKEELRWRMLIRVPEFVTVRQLAEARVALREKEKPGDFDAVRLMQMEEGNCVQMLHVGPYEEGQRTLETMNAYCAENGLKPKPGHHEIYLSDPRRVPPEKLKTILRLPLREAVSAAGNAGGRS